MLRLKLDRIMFEKKYNTKQLSEEIGIRWNTVDDLVKNRAKNWSPETLNKIMVALDIKDINELIEYKAGE
ncbi:helix-turn-helix domain-containing protein [Paenibacillus sinopodophylli]|uniref:helix-turn-helix domain-containing protein n=1 Tax=Paenibacillus sinopodophylli TaxID=1837342 RepID=UPI00110D0737|nr:helix-turn-helix transcriptional regulator [Paenibacillus sinopodophylli]